MTGQCNEHLEDRQTATDLLMFDMLRNLRHTGLIAIRTNRDLTVANDQNMLAPCRMATTG